MQTINCLKQKLNQNTCFNYCVMLSDYLSNKFSDLRQKLPPPKVNGYLGKDGIKMLAVLGTDVFLFVFAELYDHGLKLSFNAKLMLRCLQCL